MHLGWQLCFSTVKLDILDALTSGKDHQLVTDTHFLSAIYLKVTGLKSNFYPKAFEYDGI